MSFRYSPTTGGFYPVAITYPNMPNDVVAITAEEHAALIAGESAGKIIVPGADGRPILVGPPEPTLDELKAAAIERINREAGAERGKRITVTIGQEGTYTAKQVEGERFARGEPGPFPYLQAEADATGQALEEVAALVNATAAAWTTVNAAIEGRRRGALVAVDKAIAPSQIAAIFPIAWPE